MMLALALALVQEAVLRGEVVDADTGRPLPCRLYIDGPDGKRHTARSSGAIPYVKERRDGIAEVHTTLPAGPFEAPLTAGTYTLTAERGKEYRTETVRAEAGASITVKLRRWTDAAARGWWSGETHVHRPADELPLLQLAEDLNVAFPFSTWALKAGEVPVEKTPVTPALVRVDDTHVYWPRNTEYEIFSVGGKSHTLGAVFILGHRALPSLGAPPIRPAVDALRGEGVLLELDKHNWPWSMMLVPVLNVDLYELANNHHWRTDFGFRDFGEREAEWMGVERDARGWTEAGWTEFGFRNYYALLNCGFRLRPTAGSASGVHPVPLGYGRVYVHLDVPFSYEAWMKGLDAGRSFVTTGPMLYLDARPVTGGLRVLGSVENPSPLSRVEIVVNGSPLREIKAGAVDETVAVDETSWVAVRAYDGKRFAHSAPWWIDVPGKPLRPRKQEVEYLLKRVEDQLARNTGVLSEPALDEYRGAAAAYRKLLETAR
ncbi:MAG TPA: hypothetical protein VF950_12065 [Planctomycetota bacterium]